MKVLCYLIPILCWQACIPTLQRSNAVAEQLFLEFDEIGVGDTLHIAASTEQLPDAKTLSIQTLQQVLSESRTASILGESDAQDVILVAEGRFMLDPIHWACMIRKREGWWEQVSFAIYQEKTRTFSSVVAASFLEGGDGGQGIEEYWWIPGDGGGQNQLIRHKLDRWIDMNGDSVQEHRIHEIGVTAWQDGRFQSLPVLDTAQYIRECPIDW